MAASPVFQSAALGRPFALFPPVSLLAQLRDTPKLAAVTPASRLEVRPAPEMVPSGIPELDVLTGGWPRGCLSEICGSVSSGRTSIALAALAQATQRGEACALVDASDILDPASAGAAGIEMERLLWIRCGKPVLSSQFSVPSSLRKQKNESHLNFCEGRNLSPQRHRDTEKSYPPTTGRELVAGSKLAARSSKLDRLEQVLKITDLLLQSNGFGMIILDLADIPVLSARRIPLASWFRFRRAVEHTPTVLLVIEQQPVAGSCSSLLVKVTGQRSQVKGCKSQKPSQQHARSWPAVIQASGKKLSAFSHQLQVSGVRYQVSGKTLSISEQSADQEKAAARSSHTELLDRLEITAELLRSRLDRKPVQSVVNFRSRAKWTG